MPRNSDTKPLSDEAKADILAGKWSDGVIAERYGNTRRQVEWHRAYVMKLPPVDPPGRKMPLEVDELLGTMPDAHIGEIYGYTRSAVSKLRRKKGVEPFVPPPNVTMEQAL